ncbi:SDR family NAD(P)-dependent oxidoreductase [Sneathiella limimaris]|uniref:SDR family NAD(P)-dependent oxidoreductase n=1 Tax=Sneathiella limimaris TaxID=1964213 RepID=UPI00146BB3A8|nr:SDR family NAD(P)-dependent oxidoreductase [Sneathiella limimaris]
MSFSPKNIAVIGGSGAIGSSMAKLLIEKYPAAKVSSFSRNGEYPIDYSCEDSLAEAAYRASKNLPLDMVFVANGILHEGDIMPEKSLRELTAEKFHRIFEVNTVTPALIAKYFLPKLNKEGPSRFAVLSARVGSVSDNRLGGWYAYRSSKAALNMIIKNAAIEIGRKNRQAIIVGLHPGTVDSDLSKPFQSNVPADKLFTPEYSAGKLLSVLDSLKPENSGKCFAWDGEEIFP